VGGVYRVVIIASIGGVCRYHYSQCRRRV
jgi:hypothetical protein